MAQLTVQQLIDLYAANIPDNNQRLISAEKTREVLKGFVDSLANLYQKVQYDYYSPIKLYVNNDVTLYGDRLFKKINGSGTGITPTAGVNWTQLTNTFATEDQYGFTRFANSQEVDAAIEDNLAISPARLQEVIDNIDTDFTGGQGISVDNLSKIINFTGGTVTPNFLNFLVQNGNLGLSSNFDVVLLSQGDTRIEPEGSFEINFNGNPALDGQILHQTATGLQYIHKPTEFSYRYTLADTIFEDLYSSSINVTGVIKTVGINTVELSVNGGAYFDLIAALPYTVVAGANVLVRISYNGGYNSGVVTFVGEKIG